MLKLVGTAIAAMAVVYEVATVGYSALMLSVSLPAEQRCEGNAMKLMDQLGTDSRLQDSAFQALEQTCKTSAATVGALLPQGIRQ